MGKITNALKRAAEDRIERFEKIARVKEHEQLVIKKIGNSKVDQRIIAYFDPNALITEQYKILRNFSLKLLENTKEIDPEISNIVNQYFIELL